MAYPGTRVVIELEGQTQPIATPYLSTGWLVGGAVTLAVGLRYAQRLARLWLKWRDALRRGIPRLFRGTWDERWLDPIAEWLASQPELSTTSTAHVKEALRDPTVVAAAVTSSRPAAVVAAALAQEQAEVERLLSQLLQSPRLSPAEQEIVRRLVWKLHVPPNLDHVARPGDH